MANIKNNLVYAVKFVSAVYLTLNTAVYGRSLPFFAVAAAKR